MELRDLRAFVTLGDLLHFGHAADRLHLTQSALSKQIQRLESSIGGALFERNASYTRLTPMGRDLHDEARMLLDGFGRFSDRARQAAQGVLGTLRIAFGVSSNSIALRAISQFRETRPDIRVELFEMSARPQIQAMRDGALDVGFCRLPAPEGWPTLPVVQASLVALLPHNYRENISLEELVRLPLATIARARAPAFHDHMMNYFAQKRLRVQTLQTVNEFSTAMTLAEAGVAWAIVPSSTALQRVDARLKPFDDECAQWQIGLVRPPGEVGSLVQHFWATVDRICTESPAKEI